MTKTVEYQSIDVPYPEKLYAVALWFEESKVFPTFLLRLHKDFNAITSKTTEMVSGLKDTVIQQTVQNEIVIVELKFEKLHPLSHEMWEEPVAEFTDFRRNVQFAEVLNKKDLYNVVVTPVINKKNDEVTFDYLGAFTILKSADNIDDLMKSSRIFVSPEAKVAGIYSIKNIEGYDTEKKKVINKFQKDIG